MSDLSEIDGRLRPTTSLDRGINTEHINQLSRFHAKKILIFNSCLARSGIIFV